MSFILHNSVSSFLSSQLSRWPLRNMQRYLLEIDIMRMIELYWLVDSSSRFGGCSDSFAGCDRLRQEHRQLVLDRPGHFGHSVLAVLHGEGVGDVHLSTDHHHVLCRQGLSVQTCKSTPRTCCKWPCSLVTRDWAWPSIVYCPLCSDYEFRKYSFPYPFVLRYRNNTSTWRYIFYS